MKLNVDLSELRRCADEMSRKRRENDSDSCPVCDGWGKIWEGGMSLNPFFDNERPCPECNPADELD